MMNHLDGRIKHREYVVLVDEDNNILGLQDKFKVHGAITPLHRGFSCFIFNSKNQLLLQQRSKTKKTWPLVWSNSCCGHPMLGESDVDAAKRRLKFELGLHVKKIEKASDYRYCFVHEDVMENEICPILYGYSEDQPVLNPDEVENFKWVNWPEFLLEIKKNPQNYSDWCVEEAKILQSELNKLKLFL